MKKRNYYGGSVAFVGAMLLTMNATFAQSVDVPAATDVPATTDTPTVTTTTTTAAGTISQFSPNTIVVRTESGVPVGYTYSKTTTYVDENGNPVSIETVKSGLPVTVYYTNEGSKMVANKVVVRRTTATGTISQFNPGSIVVKTTTSSDPISYSYTKTTTYVDENGNPVSMETVKSGLPVTVYYDSAGNKMVATKVIVRRSTTTTTTTPNP